MTFLYIWYVCAVFVWWATHVLPSVDALVDSIADIVHIIAITLHFVDVLAAVYKV